MKTDRQKHDFMFPLSLQIQDQKNLLLNIIRSNGFYFSDLETKIINNQNNSVDIFYIFNLGDRAIIKNINFQGNKIFKDTKLRNVIRSEEGKFWKFITSNKYLDEKRIEFDEFLLTEYYQNKGYYNVNVRNTYAELDKKGNFNLTYNINAGIFYYFNDFKLNLPENYNIEDFEKITNRFPKLQGEKFSIDDFNQILFDIENVATSRLYDFINAKVVEEVVDGNKLNLNFIVSDSKKYYVERINILGNYSTIEEVIRNKLIVDEGDPLNNLLFNKSINEIKSLNIFKNFNS